jgi:hypothetical protein
LVIQTNIGEIYYYSHMPTDIKSFFPKVYGTPEVVSDTFSITLERVSGTNFSHLVINRALTNYRLTKYLSAIASIHKSDGYCDSPIDLGDALLEQIANKDEKLNIYANYHAKLKNRFEKHYTNIYFTLGEDVNEFYESLSGALKAYQDEEAGIPTKVIHGDPVFSNGILTATGEIFFIDMRGQLGDKFTIAGDCMYDLAKVYQCLFGYDFVISDTNPNKFPTCLSEAISSRDAVLLRELRAVFWEFVINEYGPETRNYLKYLTSSLYFSMMPYHAPNRWPLFYELAKQVIQE